MSSSDPKNIRICENHWPENVGLEKTKGGRFRPVTPPSIFSVPKSCLPTHKPPPRPSKIEYATQSLFDEKDLFSSFDNFAPFHQLEKKYKNIMCQEKADKKTFVFFNSDWSETIFIVSVVRKETPCVSILFCLSHKK